MWENRPWMKKTIKLFLSYDVSRAYSDKWMIALAAQITLALSVNETEAID